MELLSKRIGETMERFAIFSGLPGLAAKNLYIKNDKGVNPAPLDGIVSDYIKSGDVIIFDLEYNEIWVEVDMTLFCLGKEYKIIFSLRVNLNEKITTFKQNIISISVELWNYLIKEDLYENEIYYLLKKFEFDGIRKLETINELEKTYSIIQY